MYIHICMQRDRQTYIHVDWVSNLTIQLFLRLCRNEEIFGSRIWPRPPPAGQKAVEAGSDRRNPAQENCSTGTVWLTIRCFEGRMVVRFLGREVYYTSGRIKLRSDLVGILSCREVCRHTGRHTYMSRFNIALSTLRKRLRDFLRIYSYIMPEDMV